MNQEIGFDHSTYNPISCKDSHWGIGQAGFNMSTSGRIYLSDNKPIRCGNRIYYPCHRDLINGEGIHKTKYPGIYSWSKEIAIWLYPDLERNLTKDMKRGLAKLIGVHRITNQTPVKSNTERDILFLLGDI